MKGRKVRGEEGEGGGRCGGRECRVKGWWRRDGGEGSVICTYINIAGIHVVRPNNPRMQQQPDTVAVIWRQGRGEEGEGRKGRGGRGGRGGGGRRGRGRREAKETPGCQ